MDAVRVDGGSTGSDATPIARGDDVEIRDDVAAPALPEIRIRLRPPPPPGWEQGLRPIDGDVFEIAFRLVDDTVTFRAGPELMERALEVLDRRIAAANEAWIAATPRGPDVT